MIRRSHILVVLLALLILGALFCGPASALTVSGGTEEQRACVREVIESCYLDYQWTEARLGEVDVSIEDLGTRAAGLAWPRRISIHEVYEPGFSTWFGEIVAHEWCHQIWYTIPLAWRSDWYSICTADATPDSHEWLRKPSENFAECMRVALFDPRYYVGDEPRTNLVKVPPEECWEYLTAWRCAADSPFYDELFLEDTELQAAAGYLSSGGIMQGYTDGTFGAYQPLLKRHVALICARAGLEVPDWLDDYTPATRADTAAAIPGLVWLEERMDEGITRSQLARLIWRAR